MTDTTSRQDVNLMQEKSAETAPLFDRLGGDAAVDACVEKFYVKVLADERIKHMFADVEMAQLINHQKRFMKMAFGGQIRYSGRSLRVVHSTINNGGPPTEEHFTAVAECLISTL